MRIIPILSASLLIFLLIGCREQTATPPPPVTPTQTLTPTDTPPTLAELVDSGDPLPPQVIDTLPGGGQELLLGGVIEVHFDQSMDPEATTAAWRLEDPGGVTVDGDITWPTLRILRFAPARPLLPDTTYNATLRTEARSAEGIPLTEPLSFSMRTIGDLEISQVFPANGAAEIESRSAITVIFNRPVVPLGIVEEQDQLPDPLRVDPPILGHGEWLNTSVYVFRPVDTLRGSTTYNVEVQAGLSSASGAELKEPFEWQFTTSAPTIESLSLVDGIIEPPNGYLDVRPDQAFEIRFSQPMDTLNVEQGLSLTVLGDRAVPLTPAWDVSGATLIFTPTVPLQLDTDYVLVLPDTVQAADGGQLREGLSWFFRTQPLPGIAWVTPTDGTIQSRFDGRMEINFRSPMRLDTLFDRVVLSPETPQEPRWYYNEFDRSLSFYGLEPSTAYNVQFLPGMEDLYGNQIADARTIRFTTASLDPSAYLNMPARAALYRIGGRQDFFIRHVNVQQLDLELYEIPTRIFLSMQTFDISPWSYSPPGEDLIRETTLQVSGPRDTSQLRNVELETGAGEPLPPGFYFLALDSPQISTRDRFLDVRTLINATANLTFKTTPTEAFLFLTDLESGEPLARVPVTIYDEAFQILATGTTARDGTLQLELPPQQDRYQGYFALADDGEVFAFAYSTWGSGVSPYDYGIWSDYYTPANTPSAYLYTDRPLYRPGQPVYFKGVVRLNDDLRYSLPGVSEIKVTISSFDEPVYEAALPLSPFGTFDGQLDLDEDAALGSYTIEAFFPQTEEYIGGLSFSVAEYRRPEFQVEVSTTTPDVLVGETFEVTVAADYFSGGPVPDAAVDWTLRAAPFFFRPTGEFSRYSFSDDEQDTGFYPDPGFFDPSAGLIAEGQATTEADGRLGLTLPAELGEASASRQLTFEATLTDLAGNAVSGRTSLNVHRSGVYPGVRPGTYVGTANQEQRFELVLVDWDAEPVADQTVAVEILERRWFSVQEQDPDGYIRWVSTVEETPITRTDNLQVSADGRAAVSFVPPNGGIYRARVSARDAAGNAAHASAFMWVSSETFVPWRLGDTRRIDLVADRDFYTPGETAEILIASPFEGQPYALVTLERGHIRRQEVIRLESNSTVYELPITADMAPNSYLSVLLIQGDQPGLPPDFRMGMLEINVDTREQTLAVEIVPDREAAGPGEQVTYTVRTTDHEGAPAEAEVSLALTDLATLTLRPPNAPAILDYFFARRGLSVRTTVPLVFSIEHYNALLEGQITDGQGSGSGGGKGTGEFGVFDIREDFPDTAFWEAYLLTGEDGEATATVTLPDNLTTWRMDARAVTLDTQVGQETADLLSTKPLLVRPQAPRFFVAGDLARLGAAVHNNTDEALIVDVSLLAEGVTLLTPATQEVTLPPRSQALVTWEIFVNFETERVDLVFTAQGGDYTDASRPMLATLEGGGLPVYRYEAPETVGTAGQLNAAGARTEAIFLPQALQAGAGELTIQAAPSLAAGLRDGLAYLEHFPYECTEQTISRFLPNVLTTQALQAAGLADPALATNLETQVNLAVQRLYNRQNPDGGWGWWAESDSHPTTSAYVILGLVEAEAAGYAVSQDVVVRGVNYLRRQLVQLTPRSQPAALNQQAFTLYVLARYGAPDVSRTVQLFDIREQLNLSARAFLALTFAQIDALDTRLDTLLSDFANAAVQSATGSHWEETDRDPWSWDSDTRTTALILAALLKIDPENGLAPTAVRWLMSHRQGGHWRSTQETAWTLMALTEWLVASGELEGNYDFGVALNGETLGQSSANSETIQEVFELRIAVSEMLADEINRLTFARSAGEGNLYYTAHLEVTLPVEELEPLDRGVIVSRQYFALDEPETPITQAAQGDLVLARLTVVVPNALHFVVIDDPLPAGLEAVDRSLETSPQGVNPTSFDFATLWEQGWGWWVFDHIELRDERVVLSADYLPPGTYTYTYLARAGTPGTFRVIPPTAQEFYFPEVYGRGAGSLFSVLP